LSKEVRTEVRGAEELPSWSLGRRRVPRAETTKIRSAWGEEKLAWDVKVEVVEMVEVEVVEMVMVVVIEMVEVVVVEVVEMVVIVVKVREMEVEVEVVMVKVVYLCIYLCLPVHICPCTPATNCLALPSCLASS
jgi:hypothetical protein